MLPSILIPGCHPMTTRGVPDTPHQVGTWILILVLKKLHTAYTPLPDGSPVLSVSRFLALGLEFILMGTEGQRGGQKVWAAHGGDKGTVQGHH